MDRELIRSELKAVLPSLADETLSTVLNKLEEVGVSSTEDLLFIEEQDLQPELKPIQIRKLIQKWKGKGMESHFSIIAFNK